MQVGGRVSWLAHAVLGVFLEEMALSFILKISRSKVSGRKEKKERLVSIKKIAGAKTERQGKEIFV